MYTLKEPSLQCQKEWLAHVQIRETIRKRWEDEGTGYLLVKQSLCPMSRISESRFSGLIWCSSDKEGIAAPVSLSHLQMRGVPTLPRTLKVRGEGRERERGRRWRRSVVAPTFHGRTALSSLLCSSIREGSNGDGRLMITCDSYQQEE